MAFAAIDQNKIIPGAPPGTPSGVPGMQGQAPVSSGGGGVGPVSSKAAATPGKNIPAQPSAQLSSYLSANQPQSEQFAGTVADTVGGQVASAGNAIQPAVNTYTGGLYNVQPDAAINAKVASSPSSLTAQEQESFKTQLGAAGKSPNAADTFEASTPYQGLTADIQKAVEQANLWNSGNSVSNLTTALSPFESSQATSGDRTLDALLLSRTPSAYNKIQSAVAPASGLQGKLDAGAASANKALQNAITSNAATTAAAKASGSDYATGLNKKLSDYMAQAQKDSDAYNTSVNGLSTGVSNLQPQITSLKDAVAAYNAMQGSNAATGLLPKIQYGELGALPSTAVPPSIGQLASQGQYSDVAALMSLFGADAPNLPINASDAALAGKYSSPANNIPGVNSIVAPFSNPVGPGLLQAEDVYSSHPGNPALSDSKGAYDSLQAAYNAMQDAMGYPKFVPNPNQVGGTTPPPALGVDPNVSPDAPAGAVPGTAEYNAWLQAKYPGLMTTPIPSNAPPTPATDPATGATGDLSNGLIYVPGELAGVPVNPLTGFPDVPAGHTMVPPQGSPPDPVTGISGTRYSTIGGTDTSAPPAPVPAPAPSPDLTSYLNAPPPAAAPAQPPVDINDMPQAQYGGMSYNQWIQKPTVPHRYGTNV